MVKGDWALGQARMNGISRRLVASMTIRSGLCFVMIFKAFLILFHVWYSEIDIKRTNVNVELKIPFINTDVNFLFILVIIIS